MSIFNSLEQAVVSLTTETMGRSCTYTPNGGTPVSITAVFSRAYVEVEGVVSLKPILRINLADLLTAPDNGDLVNIDSADYQVMESRLDGFGGSTLILQLV
jgi:hypothetical protein